MGQMRVVVEVQSSGLSKCKHVPLLVEGVSTNYIVKGQAEPLGVIGASMNLMAISRVPNARGASFGR